MPVGWPNGVPYIDPNVQHVGISKLRLVDACFLMELKDTIVVQADDKPIAVILPYRTFIALQEEISLMREAKEEDIGDTHSQG